MYFYVTHWILFTAVLFVAKYLFNIQSPFEQFMLLLGASIVLLPPIVEIIKKLKIYMICKT